MKKFKYFGIVFGLFLVFVLVGSAKADLASTKALYSGRVSNKQTAVQNHIDRISNMSNISDPAKTQLINNFNAYNTNTLVGRLSQISNCTTEDEVISLMNIDWQLTYMLLIKSVLNYGNANIVAGRIQIGYQLINDTRTFVANYTTGEGYSFLKNNRQFATKWGIIEGAYAAGTGWTCRQHDRTDSKICGTQLNLKGGSCFWDEASKKCVGDSKLGVQFSQFDADEKQCIVECDAFKLTGCYQGGKCAANGAFEEYVGGEEPGVWTCRQHDGTDPKICGEQTNLQKEPCYWDSETKKCVGNNKEGINFAKADGDEKGCGTYCLEIKLENCYQNNKCAANGLLEKYTAVPTPVNGVCGTADKHVYAYTDTDWGGYTECKVGYSSKPEFPQVGATAEWTCAGINEGKNASCSASRSYSVCGDAEIEGEEECDWGTAINAKDCSPRYGSDGIARTCDNCNPSDCSITVLTGAVCGDGIINGRSVYTEECDDANSVDATPGDLCYNDCTKRYLDAGDTTALDAALNKLDDYKSLPADSLDANASSMDTLLINIYNVYNQQDITESEKISLIEGYRQGLEVIYANTQTLISNILIKVNAILAL